MESKRPRMKVLLILKISSSSSALATMKGEEVDVAVISRPKFNASQLLKSLHPRKLQGPHMKRNLLVKKVISPRPLEQPSTQRRSIHEGEMPLAEEK